MVAHSSYPPVSVDLDTVVSQVCDKHPDQVEFYNGGKACFGFLLSQVAKKIFASDIRVVYSALVQELERRSKL